MPDAVAPAVQVQEFTYAQAANMALRRALSEDERCIVYGEDVAKPGGIFGVTRDLWSEFGERVFDTPISETAMLGAAVGAAMMGMRPIVEIMWIDFSLVAVDQIVNQAANVRYVSAGRLSAPLVIRTQQGAAPGSCAQHSQNLEAMYAHIPGLRVGLPAVPQDAYAMLLAAVKSDDPVLIIENRTLYHGNKAVVNVAGKAEAASGARVIHSGTDVTLLSWSAMVHRTLEAAEKLASAGISAEVIDARWLCPFDWTTLFTSVRKTRRLVIAHEANLTGGFGAEVAARVSSELFGQLAAPVQRVATPDCRIPSATHLQAALIPTAAAIAAKAAEISKVK